MKTMQGILGLVGLIAVVSIGAWLKNAFWKAANQKVFARKGHTAVAGG